jgi:hypothetical protein
MYDVNLINFITLYSNDLIRLFVIIFKYVFSPIQIILNHIIPLIGDQRTKEKDDESTNTNSNL